MGGFGGELGRKLLMCMMHELPSGKPPPKSPELELKSRVFGGF